jgi:hypothetical protein
VKDTLKEKVPDAQITSIDKETLNGRTVYHISLSNPSKNAPLFVAEDGTVVTNLLK